MAERAVTGSLLEDLRRDAVHEQDLAIALSELKRRCDEHEIPFAVIGALAMRRHGYHRFTEDIDIVTTREGLDRIHQTMVGRGIVPRGPGLRKKLRDTIRAVDIDVIQSGEHAGSESSPVVYPAPSSEAFFTRDEAGISYATLPALITFKIGSGIWGSRTRDLGDVEELIKANRLDERFAEALPDPVRAAFLERLRVARIAGDIE
jgi:hypothetical protein